MRRLLRAEWAMALFVVAGLLTLPLYRADLLRERFVGAHELPEGALGAVVLAALAVAVMSLLRRDFLRLHPARLTWDDPADRGAVARRGLLRAVAGRFAVVGYLFVAAGLVLGWTGAPALLAVACSAAVFAYVAARRRRRRWLETAVPFGLAAAGALFVGTGWLWAVAGALLLAAVLAWGPIHRPGRRELVAGHKAHVVRAVAAAFGDVLALLPRALPHRLRLGGAWRFVVGGVVARRGMLAAALLIALAVPVLHAVFPVVAPAWWAGLGAYFAVLPFAGGLADITRVAGLRRWLPQSDTEIWLAAVIVLAVLAGLWMTAAVLAGLPAAPQAVPVAAAAVARTASRPDLDYSPGPAMDIGGVYMPINLVRQLLRGPLLLFFGITVIA
ncbi:DUF6297 family protein [Actinokineospora guangxiensis]|uniref:DUF6297 family protein n=1 Tax=Actinokineospora guangxiensis TaxID=1490288 RepID=A0ABW0EJM5_9PSEU